MTSFGFNGHYCAERSVDQRLGPPGALPVKPGFAIRGSSFAVRAGFSSCLIADVKST
jgi:hypothetical protein